MKKWTSVALASVFALGLAGCGPGKGQFNKQTGGAIIGGIAGGHLGSKIGKGRGKLIATIGGAIIGGLLGGAIGSQLDERDRMLMARNTQTTLEKAKSGVTTRWVNPDSGNRGTITPRRAVKVRRGAKETYCREFQQTITVGGKTERAYGRACRQPDGSWKIAK